MRRKNITVNKFLSLIRDGYDVTKKQVRINGQRVTAYTIRVKKNDD